MSGKARLLYYLGGLHLLLLAFTIVLFLDKPLYLVGVEALLVVSFFAGARLVGRTLEPLGYMRRFSDLLNDQDYASRLQGDGAGLRDLVQQFNRMLDQLHAERLRIGEQRGFLDKLLEATPSAVIVFDYEGRISLVNASAQQLLETDSLRGRLLAGVVHPLALQLDALPEGESRLLSGAGGRRFRAQRGRFFDRGFARQFLLIDELTEELESSERGVYEKLIRVLAHEVNNTVAATGSVLDSLLYYSAQLADADRSDFTTAIDAVKRRNVSLGEFIERFTRVVKMPAPELRPVDVAALVEDILWLYREPCRQRGIALGWGVKDELGPVPMDRHLMEQALVNIVKNAMEAAGEGGSVLVELRKDGPMLSVVDSGNLLVGVPGQQLFTPFFTTKKGGQGIGLMMVREVLARHGYGFDLHSQDGKTRFDITLAG
jgi:nitrogen fixation/metabolism regulation signal transduction histidine kinase